MRINFTAPIGMPKVRNHQLNDTNENEAVKTRTIGCNWLLFLYQCVNRWLTSILWLHLFCLLSFGYAENKTISCKSHISVSDSPEELTGTTRALCPNSNSHASKKLTWFAGSIENSHLLKLVLEVKGTGYNVFHLQILLPKFPSVTFPFMHISSLCYLTRFTKFMQKHFL